MASDGDASVDYINRYASEHHSGRLQCISTPHKGRTLVATRAFAQGELILTEEPLHIVREDPEGRDFEALSKLCAKRDFDYEPLWYWAALKSLTAKELGGEDTAPWEPLEEERQARLLMLHAGELEGPGEAAAAIAKRFAPRLKQAAKLEQLLQAWVHNAFDYSDDPPGYATYFFPSFMSHSCFPSAFWHYGDNDAYVLRARRDIAVGDEVTVSYLDEYAMLSHRAERRWDLWETKQFWCACERCDSKVDRSRGMCCPRCHRGSVFAQQRGTTPSKSCALEPGDFADAVCGWCSHALTSSEAAALNRQEKALAKIVESWDAGIGPTEEDVKQTDEFLQNCFAQHSVADKARDHLAKFYSAHRQRPAHIQALLDRTSFHAAAYPGLSAARGWSLENYGDAVAAFVTRSSPPKAEGTAKLQMALRAYVESLRILQLMFGEEHEYAVKVRKKIDRTKAGLKAMLAGG